MTYYIVDPEHPIADKSGRVIAARHALYAKIGPGPHVCECDKIVDWPDLKVRHLDKNKKNINPDNLVVSCLSCIQLHSSPRAIQPGEIVWYNRSGRRSRGVEKICARCERKFVVEAANARNNPKVGTYCSGSCRSIATNMKAAAARRAAKA